MSKNLPITVISAGAGSGKTFTLTARMIDMLAKGVRPSAIIATTFTRKAAAELQERVRAKLLETGQSEAANELGSALIGTVHSVGIKLLQRFAFDAGVSPLVEVIADGDEQRLFNESLSQILTSDRTDQMNLLADRLGLTKSGQGRTNYDWRADIRRITDVARANNFTAAILDKSKKLSWETFSALLPPATNTDAITWNNRLIAALEQTAAALEANTADTTATTAKAAEALLQMVNNLKWRGELYWHEWVKISKINPAKKSIDLMDELHTIAGAHTNHAGFQADVKGYIDMVFDIAGDALREYENYKQKRGLIDYTDMEAYVSRLLRIPAVVEALRDELDLLLVDEFQDTSPIQLDIFLQLSRIAKHSIWVGDPKQSIYGFRGADPALMQAIIDATGGVKPENILGKSWRSRPDIVETTNAIFTKAFPKMPVEQVVLEPAFPKQKENDFWKAQGANPLSDHRAVMHWHFLNEVDNAKTPGKPWMEDCIAAQIAILLERKIPVFDKSRKTTRPVRPGDIAVLCKRNDVCESVAESLHKMGLQASVARAGLVQTPEIKLALAYLKRLVNPNDRLSAAEIKLISGDTTLEALLHQLATADPERKWAALDIPSPGADLHLRSAAEALDLLISETDLRRKVVRLGNAVQRLDNLEILRRYALEYESACQRLRSASTISGFLLWLDALADNRSDFQGSGESSDTVNVLTYHKSKGLEYPVCICHNLDANLKEMVWGINLVAEKEPDLDDILGGRWLRFWVNPYADQVNGTALKEALDTSEASAAATVQALAEEARLLYVGITRARDYLIFPTNRRDTKWLNRVFSNGNESATTLLADTEESPFYTAGGQNITLQLEQVFQPVSIGEKEWETAAFPFFAPPSGKQMHYPEKINPWQEAAPAANAPAIGDPVFFTPQLVWEGEYEPGIEKAVLALLTASTEDGVAAHQIKVRQLEAFTTAAAIAAQANAALKWIFDLLPGATIHRSVPLRAIFAERVLEHNIDFWLENTEGVITLVQIMPFQSGKGTWKSSAAQSANVLGWIAAAVATARPGAIIRKALISPVGGRAIDLGVG